MADQTALRGVVYVYDFVSEVFRKKGLNPGSYLQNMGYSACFQRLEVRSSFEISKVELIDNFIHDVVFNNHIT